jgi:cyclopropane fatty-acyl-phospholipid synthase-like methyltransferase
MDPLKFTTIAHHAHEHLNPVDPDALEQAVERVALRPGDRAIDVGCGKAALLIRLAERHGVAGTGVDLNPAFLAEARTLAARRGVAAAVTLIEGDASTIDLPAASFHLGICVGATHALGGYPGTLRGLARLVRPRGHLLIGHGYWKRAPDPEYLERLGATLDEMTSHEGNIDAGIAAGLKERGAWVSRDEDWDRYEDLYADTVERYAAQHPTDPDTPAMLERIRRWRETYLRWGRETLGFGLYLFRRT